MKYAMLREFRSLLPASGVCLLAPLPAVVFWQSDSGRSAAVGCFFLGCASLVAYSFGGELKGRAGDTPVPDRSVPQRRWFTKVGALGLALFASLVAFSAFSLTLNDAHDLDVPLVGLLILVPSLCTVPYLTLLTRKPFAAVVFALALVGCMKLLGGVVVVLTYGWNASQLGHTRMPWTDPNLLVWVFWLLTGVYSAALYVLGYRAFQALSLRPDV